MRISDWSSDVCSSDLGNLRSGNLDDRDMDRLVSQSGFLREAPLYIDETGAMSPLDVRARARRVKSRHGLGLIIVDYIQIMQIHGNKAGRVNEISEISHSHKAHAKALEDRKSTHLKTSTKD